MDSFWPLVGCDLKPNKGHRELISFYHGLHVAYVMAIGLDFIGLMSYKPVKAHRERLSFQKSTILTRRGLSDALDPNFRGAFYFLGLR